MRLSTSRSAVLPRSPHSRAGGAWRGQSAAATAGRGPVRRKEVFMADIGGMADKAKDAAQDHPEKVDQAKDKAKDAVDGKDDQK